MSDTPACSANAAHYGVGAAWASAVACHAGGVSAACCAPRRVLVLDADPAAGAGAADLIRGRSGCEVFVEQDVGAAPALIQDRRPDFVLLAVDAGPDPGAFLCLSRSAAPGDGVRRLDVRAILPKTMGIAAVADEFARLLSA
jgi:hypothetical protein